jgi:CIC family chloride channel protein
MTKQQNLKTSLFSILRKKHQKLRRRTQRFLSAHGASDYTILILLSIVLGAGAGLTAVGFHHLVDFISEFSLHRAHHSHFAWLIILVPAAGMFLQWLMIKLAPDESERRGVIEIIKSVSLKNGVIPFKTTLFHFLAPAICIGTGNTVGPEAPVAQTGAGVVSASAKLLGLRKDRVRIFTAAGAGAAIAGVFNTPLAGVFFCIEVVLLNEIRASALSVFLLMSVSASAVSRIFLGNAPRFLVENLHIGPLNNLVFYLVLGIGSGLLSLLFIRSNEYVGKLYKKLYQKFPKLGGMLIAGLLMGIAGFFVPDVLGVGYSTINSMLAGDVLPWTALLLFVLKFVLVIVILSSGAFGGIFAPSLFLGAGWGYFLAFALNQVIPVQVDPTTFCLVGMGAMLAGINSVPITAIMILFEMTNDYHFILPLMMGVVGSHVISHLFLNGSIYQRKLERAGYQKSSDIESGILRSTLVNSVMRTDFLLLPNDTPISELVRRFLDNKHDTVFLHDANHRVCSVISSRELQHLVTDYINLRDVLVAQDIAEPFTSTVSADVPLDTAIRLFSRHRVDELPVVDPKNDDRVIGTLHYYDVINVMNKGMVQQSIKTNLAMDFKNLEKEDVYEVVPGFSLAQVTAPEKFINKNLGDLRLRNIHDIDVLMVERSAGLDGQPGERVFVHKDFIFNRGDKLVIYGRTLDVMNFKMTLES